MSKWEADVNRLKANDPSLTKLSLQEFTAVLPAAVRGVVLASPYQHLSSSSSSTGLTPSGGTTEGPKASQEHLLRTTQQVVVGSASLARVDGVKSLPPASDAAKVQVADIHSRAIGISNAQSPSRLFTASSGERVLFRQMGGQWQAELQVGTGTTTTPKRTLPVVSSGDIRMLLAGLQRQDVWACRSRIHIMNTANPPYTPSVYLGKCGLLGGAPTQKPPSSGEGEWRSGPTMTLASDMTRALVFQIPQGYRYKDYRYKTDPVTKRASFSIHYVEANNKEAIFHLEESNNGNELEAKLNANFGNVFPIGGVEGGGQTFVNTLHKKKIVQQSKHAGLVLFGQTQTYNLVRGESKLDVELEICVEEIFEDVKLPARPTLLIPPAPTPGTTTNDDHLPSPATPTPSSINSTDPFSDVWSKMEEAMQNENSRPIELPVEFIYSCTNNLNITKKLGQGAFGAVYKGKDDNQYFAVKRILFDIAVAKDKVKEVSKTFKIELAALKRFRHPHIVSLYGYHLSAGSPSQYLVYEFASNGSLDTFYTSEQRRESLSSEIRVQIMSDIICAIHYLHTGTKDNLGLFHRDIKSANICLDQNYTAKLIDCGLAKFVLVDESIETNKNFFSVQITSTDGVFGTPGCRCPWYSKGGKTFEASCDVYSFGIVMIELVTGCLQNDRTKLGQFSEHYFPSDFEGNAAEALKLAIPKLVNDADPLAKEWEDGILSSVCELAIRCIQNNRLKRPTTIELVENLGQLVRPTDHIGLGLGL